MKAFIPISILVILLPANFAAEQVVELTSEVTKDSPLKLTCGNVRSVQDNDTISWVYVNASDVSTTLENQDTSLNITDNTATGRYTCSLNGVEQVTYLAAKNTNPVIKNSGKSITYNDGDVNRKIVCTTPGTYPDPVFTWLKRGDLEGERAVLLTEDSNYRITANGTNSTLLIYNVTYDEAKTFICDVEYVQGNATVEILVRVKNKYAAIWPFIGIVTEVVILIAVIFLYERHSKKEDKKKDLIVEAEDEKPLNRDEGMEVRNRNGGK